MDDGQRSKFIWASARTTQRTSREDVCIGEEQIGGDKVYTYTYTGVGRSVRAAIDGVTVVARKERMGWLYARGNYMNYV